VAMQFAYQFPERTERLVLVASGGLGPDVSPLIRAITTPGFHPVMAMLTLPGVRHAGKVGLRSLAKLPLPHTRDLDGSPRSTTPSRTRPPVTRSGTWSARSSTGAARWSPWPTAPT
jgi:hypothetical protein